ncbi:MAG: phosphopentomutase [Firmicutes bacterium HGW-Firmicutes-11]|jgi:phosphopentomutase|nr:MAG: phosphopentomutase [Firmicutes bacterium HGW-Firmicutes-11]
MKRVILIVLDSLGIGALPDANTYGDEGANTLGNILKAKPDLAIPNLAEMGLGWIEGVSGISKPDEPIGTFGRLAERSMGKDTITGHWEIAGLYTEVPFKTFEKFPADFIQRYEEAIGVETLGNYAASGTEIIKELGPLHEKTGKPIIYTSADSVFQIAVNTDVVPLEVLYRYCEIAREMLVGDVQVGRVIARPFVERDGVYTRTSDRKDYAVSPSGKTVLDHINDSGMTVFAVGKISDIFNGQGITESVHTKSNMDGVDQTLLAMNQDFSGIIFANLVDFDSLYGHRRDAAGYGKALEDFDLRLPELKAALREEDILILCADHGNDPGHTGWDHTREYVPVLLYGASINTGINLGTRSSFADIAATIAEYLSVEAPVIGQSFLVMAAAVVEE